MQNLGEATGGGGGVGGVVGVRVGGFDMSKHCLVIKECPYHIPPGQALWEWEE